MSELIRTLKKATKGIDELYSIVGTVTARDHQARTVDVQPVNGDAEVFGVRLQAAPGASVGLLAIPAVGSEVVVTFLNKATGFVALCSEVETYELVSGNTSMRLDDAGFFLANTQTNLADLLTDLAAEVKAVADAIALLTVTCASPGSPSTVPINAASFTAASARLTTLSTTIETLLKDA